MILAMELRPCGDICCAPVLLVSLLLLAALLPKHVSAEAAAITRVDFPEGFVFGASTSAYQAHGQRTGRSLSSRTYTRTVWHQQPPGSVLCEFYCCEFMRENGRYIRNPDKKFQVQKIQNFNEQAMLNIAADLSSFIMRDIIYREEKYHDYDAALSSRKYKVLINVAALNLTKGGF